MAAPKRAVQQLQKVSFLSPKDYSKGGGTPDGDYLWSALDFVQFQPQKKDGTIVGPSKLAIRIQMDPVNGYQEGEEPRPPVHYSLGSSAHLTYQPDPETGKGLVLVPGGPAAPLYESTNAYILMKSLWDSGMPEDLGDDLTLLEGIVVHITSIPEPEERKGFRTSTSEVQPEQKERKIPVVMEIKSAPWMEGATPTPVKVATKPAPVTKPQTLAERVASAAPKPKVNGKPATPPPPADDDNKTAVTNAVASFLETNPNGVKKAALRMACFRVLADNPARQDIMTEFFSDDEALGGVLGEIGYKVEGDTIALA